MAPALGGKAGRAYAQGGQDFSDATDELGGEVNTYEDITTYNNFYEFGTDKRDPSRNSGDFKPQPWTVEVNGHCANRAPTRSRTCSRPTPRRTASTGSAAWRPGRW